ncbi:hypothetical protein [Nonomuraea sp. NPDC050691]
MRFFRYRRDRPGSAALRGTLPEERRSSMDRNAPGVDRVGLDAERVIR